MSDTEQERSLPAPSGVVVATPLSPTSSRRSRTRSASPAGSPTEAEQAWYLAHFNQHVAHLHTYRHGAVSEAGPSLSDARTSHRRQNDAVLPANSRWTAEEKDAFFGALARHSRWAPDRIAADIGTKTPGEVTWYLETLRAMAVDLEQEQVPRNTDLHRQPWQAGFAPAAREVSERWMRQEERLAAGLVETELGWEQEARAMRRDKADRAAARRALKRKRTERSDEAAHLDVEIRDDPEQLDTEMQALLDNKLAGATGNDLRAIARILKARRREAKRSSGSADRPVDIEGVIRDCTTAADGTDHPNGAPDRDQPRQDPELAAWQTRISLFDPIIQQSLVRELLQEQQYRTLQHTKKRHRTEIEREDHRLLGLLINTRIRDRRRQAGKLGIELVEDERPSAASIKVQILQACGKTTTSKSSQRKHAALARVAAGRDALTGKVDNNGTRCALPTTISRHARPNHRLFQQIATMLIASATDLFDLKRLAQLLG